MNDPVKAAGTRDVPDNAAKLTLSQAAARLGISEKTLRKRIHAGEVIGEKLPLEGGGVGWIVYLESSAPEVVPEEERNFTVPRAGSAPEVVHSQNAKNVERVGSGTEARRNITPEVTETRAGTVPEVAPELQSARVLAESDAVFLRAALESERENSQRDREQIAFLRGLVEQRDRDAAELRAALREALRAMPKAIEAREYSQNESGARNDAQAPKIAPTGKVSVGAKTGGKVHKLAAWQRVAARVLGIR